MARFVSVPSLGLSAMGAKGSGLGQQIREQRCCVWLSARGFIMQRISATVTLISTLRRLSVNQKRRVVLSCTAQQNTRMSEATMHVVLH
jgi:hypothetical protein